MIGQGGMFQVPGSVISLVVQFMVIIATAHFQIFIVDYFPGDFLAQFAFARGILHPNNRGVDTILARTAELDMAESPVKRVDLPGIVFPFVAIQLLTKNRNQKKRMQYVYNYWCLFHGK